MAKVLKYSRSFLSAYNQRIKRYPVLREEMRESIKVFLNNPSDTTLKSHSLRGRLKGKKSFSVTDDLRIIYVETKNFYIFIDIGNHNEVY